jgi:glycosyltransferase involved in cell wall biosynthesis
MSDTLTFSIVIPVYNRAALVRRAIASCLVQRHPSFEVIVVDDGSTDRTPASVSEIGDHRVRLFVQPENRGVSAARNLGASHARGEWIVLLDSDDELTPDALELIDAEARSAPDEVQGLRFMCRLDDGSVSPVPRCGERYGIIKRTCGGWRQCRATARSGRRFRACGVEHST